MAATSTRIAAPPEAVWAVLADPDSYGEWVVGTKGVVRADDGWPQVGSALEYELGIGPIAVGDRTVVVESERPRLLVLRAELRRLGTATIRLELEAAADGTRLVIDERPVEGLLRLLHTRVSDFALGRRNDEGLRRLKRLAESRAAA